MGVRYYAGKIRTRAFWRYGMSQFVTDENINEIVRYAWEDVARFAYDSFARKGRGVVRIRKAADAEDIEEMEFKMAYSAYDNVAAAAGADAAKLVQGYAPAGELVVQYLHMDGGLRTFVVKTPPGEKQPDTFGRCGGFSFDDIYNESQSILTYTPEMVYARARKAA
jgi:hypothetical protein